MLRSPTLRRAARLGSTLAVLAVLGACADAVGPAPNSAPRFANYYPSPYGDTFVCTYIRPFVGGGTWSYGLSTNPSVGTFPNGNPVLFTLPAADYSAIDPIADCTQAWMPTSANQTTQLAVTLNSFPNALLKLDSVEVRQFNNNFFISYTLPTTNPIRVTVADTMTTRVKFWFSKLDAPPPPPPPPPSGEGCTPGYWKQSQHFDSYPAPYTYASSFNGTFGVSTMYTTFVNALSAKGGGVGALARHGTAALLNAQSSAVDFGMTPAQVITLVHDAIASGNAVRIESAHVRLAEMNEYGCPLN